MCVIVVIPVTGKESVVNVSAIIKEEVSFPHVSSLTLSNGPMIGAGRISSRCTKEKRGDDDALVFKRSFLMIPESRRKHFF
jgi:hypothetical protein